MDSFVSLLILIYVIILKINYSVFELSFLTTTFIYWGGSILKKTLYLPYTLHHSARLQCRIVSSYHHFFRAQLLRPIDVLYIFFFKSNLYIKKEYRMPNLTDQICQHFIKYIPGECWKIWNERVLTLCYYTIIQSDFLLKVHQEETREERCSTHACSPDQHCLLTTPCPAHFEHKCLGENFSTIYCYNW